MKCLTPEDIKEYALTQEENLSNEEINIIFNFIMHNYEQLLNKEETSLETLKQFIRQDLYIKIINLYNKYKSYI